MIVRLTALAALCALTCACATDPAPTVWTPRADANLEADLAACTQDANNVDLRSPSAFSDARYGAAAAMAREMDRGELRNHSEREIYAAVRDSCMQDKGWKPAS